MLGDDLEEWLHESQLMAAPSANAAIIAGLNRAPPPGQGKKTGPAG